MCNIGKKCMYGYEILKSRVCYYVVEFKYIVFRLAESLFKSINVLKRLDVSPENSLLMVGVPSDRRPERSFVRLRGSRM